MLDLLFKLTQQRRTFLIGKYPESKVTPMGTSLDVAINDRQVIRVEVTPENSKGSGGGAAATKVQEAEQCV